MYRQGDVLLVKRDIDIDSLEYVSQDSGNISLASGSATGHMHVLPASHALRYRDADGNVFVRVTENCCFLSHVTSSGKQGNHDPIEVPTGTYAVIKQTEVKHGQRFDVAD